MGNKYIISRIQTVLSTAIVIAESEDEVENLMEQGKVKFDDTHNSTEETFIDLEAEEGFFCPTCLENDALSFEGPDGKDISMNPFCLTCSEHIFMEDK
tara:strand:- start:493 stop:786 length:294 start_codon:yes stop_codon:yes gene_type:complete